MEAERPTRGYHPNKVSAENENHYLPFTCTLDGSLNERGSERPLSNDAHRSLWTPTW